MMSRDTPAALRKAAHFLLWTAVFGLAYAQAPLFTSNQNQYFLHGMAHAGYGDLRMDWLANTLDPTPVFSALVETIYRLAPFDAVFYAVYILLMGVYLFSLRAIVTSLFPSLRRPVLNLALMAALVLLHSAGWRFAVSRLLGDNWTYFLEDGVADQRMLGPVLQPSSFGVLLLLSIAVYLRRRPAWAVLLAVLAATIHPTYLLAAASLTAAYMLDQAVFEKRFRAAFILGGLALIAVAPILIYSLNVFGGSGAEVAARSRKILVDIRIPHHAKVSWWFDLTALYKLAMLGAAFAVLGKRRFSLLLLVPILVAVTGTLLQVVSGSYTLALLFPWRISVLLVPLSLGIILGWALARGAPPLIERSPRLEPVLHVLSIGTVALALVVGLTRFGLDLRRKAAAPERAVQAYVARTRSPQDVYLTPVKMQDFRLETGAPVYMDFKSIPYKDVDVIEWLRRYRLADRVYLEADCDLLSEMASSEGVTKAIYETGTPHVSCAGLEVIYEDPSYTLVRLAAP